MAESITLAVDKLSEELELEPLTGSGGTVTFTSAEIGRPGLQFTGYYDHFSSRRVQIIGMSEMYYLYGLSGAEVRARMKRFMSYGVPCIVCAVATCRLRSLSKAHGNTACPFSFRTRKRTT